jgi:hypothetical protein
MTRTKLLAALLTSTALGGPAFAADMAVKAPERPAVAPISGYLEMEGGFSWMHNSGVDGFFVSPGVPASGDDRRWLFNGAGRVNWWFAPSMSAQFDVWGGVDSFGRGKSHSGDSENVGVIANSNLGLHVNYRLPEQYLVGVFGALGGIGSNANCCEGGAAFTHGTLGLEGQWYTGPITLYGQGGVQTNLSNGDDGGNYTAWFLRGEGRYFLNDNLRLNVWGMYAQGRTDGGYDFFPTEFMDFTQNFKMQHAAAGLGIEKKLDGSPLSLFARYRYAWTEFKSSFDDGTEATRGTTSDNQFTVGFRLYLNENTLRYNDRMGTTLDIKDAFTEAYRGFGRSWVCATNCGFNFSDIRLKRDIVELVRLDNGLRLYRYRYLWSDQVYVGVMAQEVAEIVPDAVLLGADGYLRVNYSRLGLRLMTWDEWTAAAHRLPLAA